MNLKPRLAHFKEYYRSVVASVFFASNIFFWATTGYFDADAADKPLLHTWSLGVEEQFYMVIPIALFMMSKLKPRTSFILFILLLLSSLLASCLMVFNFQRFTFMLLPTRAWELGIGVLVALLVKHPRWVSTIDHLHRYRYPMSVASLLFMIFPIFLYDSSIFFPGLAAVPPCLGAALFIYMGSRTEKKPVINSFLSMKPFVSLGLISYSVYLWHWPILVFLRGWTFAISSVDPSSDQLFLGSSYIIPVLTNINSFSLVVVMLSLACGYLSLRYVENPFRKRLIFKNRGTFFAFVCLFGLFLTISGLSLSNEKNYNSFAFGNNKYKGNLSLDGKDTLGYYHPVKYENFISNGLPRLNKSFDETHKPDFVFLGNSHAWHFHSIFEEFTRNINIDGRLYAGINKPFMSEDIDKNDSEYLINKSLLMYVIETRPKHVILSSTWNREFFTPESIDILNGNLKYLSSLGIKIWIVLPTPTLPFRDPIYWLNMTFRYGGDVNKVGIKRSKYLEDYAYQREVLTSLQNDSISILDPSSDICYDELCHTEGDGMSLYFDNNHLTDAGAKFTQASFLPLFKALLKRN